LATQLRNDHTKHRSHTHRSKLAEEIALNSPFFLVGEKMGHPFRTLTTKLREIEDKVDLCLEFLRLQSQNNPCPRIEESNVLFRLPDHLRLTYFEAQRKGEVSAFNVSLMTGRVRALESAYLNQLWRLGYLEKHRIKRDVVFKLAQPNAKIT